MNTFSNPVRSNHVSAARSVRRDTLRPRPKPVLEISFDRGTPFGQSRTLNEVRRILALAGAVTLLLSAGDVGAQKESPMNTVMSKIQMVGDVYRAASDDASEQFFEKSLPSISNFLNSQLSETKAVEDSAMLLDPSKLKLATDSDVRVYFIGEGAGYHNTLGFNTTGGGVESGDPKLIFPDASSSENYSAKLKPNSGRTPSAPLVPGDFVDLGTMGAGTSLDFFLIADGANGGKDVYSTQTSLNPDGINHVVSFAYTEPGSSYLIIGFEDFYGGGDRDFNDLLFAVDIGASNVAALTATPEPGTWMMLGTLTGVVGWTRRRITLGLPNRG
jgi:hypothetical protein